MNDLSRKRRTFFFSDIVASTQLAHQLGEAYAEVLGKYRIIIRSFMLRFQGEEVDTAGDGFFVTFREASDAVQASVMIQQSFANMAWARGINFKVRIGLHTGEAITNGSDYIGTEVHRAARICGAAHGGQVLLSKETADLLANKLPYGVSIIQLGEYILKGFDIPELLYQLVIPGIQSEFPLPRTSLPTPTIAVMPFTNQQGNLEEEYFCQGIAEELIIVLSKIPGMKVVARSSSFALQGQGLSAGEIGRRLQATAILEGKVRRMDQRLLITVELIEVATGTYLWTQRFEGDLKDIFSLEDEIAQEVAGKLKIKFLSKRVRGVQNMQTSNVEAYDYYLRGRRFYYQFSRQGVLFALEMFQKAIEEDEFYALAYCGLADCYAYLSMYVESSAENLDAADIASRRAIELDPLLAKGYASRGQVLALLGRFEESETIFQRAIELDPRLFEARYLYARTVFARGELAKAAHLFETAHRVNPEDYQSLLLAGQCYDGLGEHDEAVEARQKGIAIAEQTLNINPGDTRALYLGANALAALGRRKQALDWLGRAMTIEPEDGMLLYNAACVYAILGMKNEALDSLEKSIDQGLTQPGWLENDTNLDNIRKHPRFRKLLDSISRPT